MHALSTDRLSARAEQDDLHLQLRPVQRAAAAGSGDRGSLATYLNQMGSAPRIEPEEEIRLSSVMREERLSLQHLAASLPETCREVVLVPPLAADEEWPLPAIEAFADRLARHETSARDPQVSSTLRAVRLHVSRLRTAHETLVTANLRLVVHVAKQYVGRGVPLLDLIQEGNISLMHAAQKYDGRRGYRFSTYAHWWIRQAMERSIANLARNIRIPGYLGQRRAHVDRARHVLAQRLQRSPRASEIAEHMGLPQRQIEALNELLREPQSLEELSEHETIGTPLENLPDPAVESPLVRLQQEGLNAAVDRSLRSLSAREEEIIRLRFGIRRAGPRTLSEIGEWLDLSRERVRQIELGAMNKLRASKTLAQARA